METNVQDTTETLRGVIAKIIFHSPETGYCVLSLDCGKDGAVSANGSAIFQGDPLRQAFVFRGSWTNHEKYGRQFAFTSCEPEGGELFYFLAKVVKGLGETLAREVIRQFGDETARIIDELPRRLLEVKGIGEKKLEQVLASWQKYAPLRALANLLTPFGVTSGAVAHIFNYFGERSVALIQKNPYVLCSCPGFGFKRADKVALAMGVAQDSPERIRECVKYVMSRQADDSGDTLMGEDAIVKLVTEETTDDDLCGISAQQILDAIASLLLDRCLVQTPNGYALALHFDTERQILSLLKRRSVLPPKPLLPPDEVDRIVREIEGEMGIRLAPEQMEAVLLAASGVRTFAVAGYAGSGKTTVSRIILELYARVYGRAGICCMALSGIAADRIKNVSGFAGNTIHTSLGYTADGFTHCSENPLPYDVVVLDESSMVSGWLFLKTLTAIHDDTVLLMLGDNSQLPPIGAGDPFSDLLEHGLCPVARLTQIYRQAEDSVLLSFANSIRQGLVPTAYRATLYSDFRFEDFSIPGWFRMRQRLSKAEQDAVRDKKNSEIVARIQAESRDLHLKTKGAQFSEIISSWQVLAPMRKGALGTENLNRMIQAAVNPACPGKTEMQRGGNTYRALDKVCHLANKDMPVISISAYKTCLQAGGLPEFQETKRVFNGSVGIVWLVDDEESNVHVVYPSLGLVVCYDFIQMGDIVGLAWCLTVHKAQGNEFAEVVIPCDSSGFIMLNNKWLYTALTRAKKRALVVGEAYMFERAARTKDESKRKTVLQELCASEKSLIQDATPTREAA